LLLGLLAWDRRWVTDDAFIDFRVVQNLLDGHGPVFNIGERVEAYTNPLWVGVLAAAGMLRLPLEPASVALGLVFALVAVAVAQRAAANLQGGDGVLIPAGALVPAALSPFWDFTTSGLEMGLAFAWLALTYWGLTLRAWPFGLAFLIGMGPLIRPDFGIFSLVFFLTLLLIGRSARAEPPWWSLLVIASLPAGLYQIFRLGYFAMLAPNTALAKEAGLSRIPQGWAYATDFLGTYAVWLPLLLPSVAWALSARRAIGTGVRNSLMLLVAPVVGGLAHAGYVIWVGGDFMHGRLLLPALFAFVLPASALRLPPGALRVRPSWVGAALMVAWAALTIGWLRVDYAGDIAPNGITDERAFYVAWAQHANPIDAQDFASTGFGRDGQSLRLFADGMARGADRRVPLLLIPLNTADALPVSRPVDPAVRVVAAANILGVRGYLAGPGVFVVDRLGLADPIASRLRLTTRGRPGHEKQLQDDWIIARFADPSAARAQTEPVVAARAALACGDLAALERAITEPLTADRFMQNAALAWRFHRLRIAADPIAARAELCGSA